ncbi:MAG: hypothetical protein WD851_18640 [Pirellulales bacterium]
MSTKQKTDLSTLLAKLTRVSTGLSVPYCELLQRAISALESEPLDVASLAKRTDRSESSVRLVLNAGERLGVLNRRKRFIGAGGGRESDLWSVEQKGLQALRNAGSSPASDRLTREQWRELQHVDLCKLGRTVEEGRRGASLIAAIGPRRLTTYPELACELKVGIKTVRRAVENLASRGILTVKPMYEHGPWPRRPSEFVCDLGKVREARNEESGDLSLEFTPRRVGERLLQIDRLDKRQHSILNRTQFERAGCTSLGDWLDVKALIAAIGASQKTTYFALATEMKISLRSLHTIRDKAVKAGLLRVTSATSAGSTWLVDWDKIRELAGGRAKPAANGHAGGNGKAGKKVAAADRKRKPGRTSKYPDFHKWLATEFPKSPDVKPYEWRERFKSEKPDCTPPALRNVGAYVSNERKKWREAQSIKSTN